MQCAWLCKLDFYIVLLCVALRYILPVLLLPSSGEIVRKPLRIQVTTEFPCNIHATRIKLLIRMESGQLNVLTPPMRYTIEINEWSQAIMDTSNFKWEEREKKQLKFQFTFTFTCFIIFPLPQIIESFYPWDCRQQYIYIYTYITRISNDGNAIEIHASLHFICYLCWEILFLHQKLIFFLHFLFWLNLIFGTDWYLSYKTRDFRILSFWTLKV